MAQVTIVFKDLDEIARFARLAAQLVQMGVVKKSKGAVSGIVESLIPEQMDEAVSAVHNAGTSGTSVSTSAPVQPAGVPLATPVPTTTFTQPATPVSTATFTQPAAPVSTAAPIQNAVPVSTPSYTPDELARAAMTLMDAGKQPQLIQALTGFGVNSIPELQPDQYGAFATALRGLGAQI